MYYVCIAARGSLRLSKLCALARHRFITNRRTRCRQQARRRRRHATTPGTLPKSTSQAATQRPSAATAAQRGAASGLPLGQVAQPTA